jgi:hypothetical protein
MHDEERGWVRWGPRSTPEERERRRREGQLADERAEAEFEAAHRRLFGGADPMHVEVSELVMPVSRVRFRWRTDGYVAVEQLGEPPEANPWTKWADDAYVGVGRLSESIPGDSAEPTWWLWWGASAPDAAVSVWLADNSDVEVARLGWLWIVEYVSLPQTAFVSVDREVRSLPSFRGASWPPPPYPVPHDEPNPRA